LDYSTRRFESESKHGGEAYGSKEVARELILHESSKPASTPEDYCAAANDAVSHNSDMTDAFGPEKTGTLLGPT
jgi:hypothetical protein